MLALSGFSQLAAVLQNCLHSIRFADVLCTLALGMVVSARPVLVLVRLLNTFPLWFSICALHLILSLYSLRSGALNSVFIHVSALQIYSSVVGSLSSRLTSQYRHPRGAQSPDGVGGVTQPACAQLKGIKQRQENE